MRNLAILFVILTSFYFQFASANQFTQTGRSHFSAGPTEGLIGQTMFVRLTGTLSQEEDPSLFLDKLTTLFDKPIRDGKFGHFYYIMQVSGRSYFMNFIAEPFNSSHTKAFTDYIAKLEGTTVHGLPVDFHLVEALHETATFQVGTYDHDAHDPFGKNYEINRHFTFKNIAQWLEFTDGYAVRLKSPDHSVFEKFVEEFINDANDYRTVSEVLKKNNMAAIDPRVGLTLENNTTVDSDFEHTAFLPYRFIRSCFWENYEGGSCYR